jgi:Tfp pilus assembly protein PilN
VTTPTLSTTQLAALPRVNLLPPEIAEKRRARTIQAGLGGAVALSVVGVVAGYVLAHASATHAKSQLADAQADTARLQTQVAQYAGDETLRAQLAAEQGMLTAAMGSEVQWSHYLNDLTLRIPDNVWVQQLTITEGTSGSGQPGAQPAATNSIGSVSVTGVAFTHDDVATWLDSLAKEKGYANPYFSSSTSAYIGSRGIVKFSSTTQVTPDALSGRYTHPAGS